jgi:hypothetical protein
MSGLFGWIEKTFNVNVSNYDFDDSGNAVSYTIGDTTVPVSDSDGKNSLDYALEADPIFKFDDDDGGDSSSVVKTDFSDADNFGEAFNEAYNTLGSGATFTYNGQEFKALKAGEDPAFDAALAEDNSYFAKLEAAGESDMSVLDQIAESDLTGINVFGPTDETKAAIEQYYTEGPGSPGYTSEVDYNVTSSGEDYEIATQMDDADISGGVATKVALSPSEQLLVDTKGWIDNGDGTLTPIDENGAPRTWNYDADREAQWDWNATDGYEVIESTVSPVEVNTFSDNEVVVSGGGVGDLAGPYDGTQTYGDTVLEPGTGGISGIRTGDPMTQQLAAELGINYFEGDTIQSDDLIKLADLGFDVSQADLTQAKSEVPFLWMWTLR